MGGDRGYVGPTGATTDGGAAGGPGLPPVPPLPPLPEGVTARVIGDEIEICYPPLRTVIGVALIGWGSLSCAMFVAMGGVTVVAVIMGKAPVAALVLAVFFGALLVASLVSVLHTVARMWWRVV